MYIIGYSVEVRLGSGKVVTRSAYLAQLHSALGVLWTAEPHLAMKLPTRTAVARALASCRDAGGKRRLWWCQVKGPREELCRFAPDDPNMQP